MHAMTQSGQPSNKTTTDRIAHLRDRIDRIDQQVLELINQRLRVGKEIGDIKADRGTQVADEARENLLIQRLLKLNTGPLTEGMLREIYRTVIAASRELQRHQRVAFLGPEATFSHIAARHHFGPGVKLVPHTSIEDIFSDVEKEACDYGVVPVENSIEGSVNRTLDLLFETRLVICAEKYQNISHDLLSISGKLEDIKAIYSHDQALAQCRKWLRRHCPEAALKESSSTAEAARKAAENPAAAAIASREAGTLYQLKIVSPRIEDYPRNVTRFLVIGRDQPSPTGNDKTSLMFVTSHIPGALHHALQPIADAGLNMVKLESRPMKHENWSYFFFVDLEGHRTDRTVRETMDRMMPMCLYLKCAGSYPKGEKP